MANMSKLELLDRLDFERDPFKAVNYKTGDSSRIHRIVSMAVKARAMVSIVGERGSGKSKAVIDALKNLRVRQVAVRSLDKFRLLISGIERAMILDLSDEKPKRSGEIRARQLRRILGEASLKNEVVLVIEEGHRLHGMTLRAPKSLRELDWMGETELFTVVLLGQSDPMNKSGMAEVKLRTDTIYLQGLTHDEIERYIQGTVGKVFSNEAINAVKSLPEARNFLNLQNMLVSLMGRALADGREKVLPDDVKDEFGVGQTDTSKQADIHNIKVTKKEDDQKGSPALKAVLDRH